MKKNRIIVLCLALLVIVTACGQGKQKAEPVKDEKTEVVAEAEKTKEEEATEKPEVEAEDTIDVDKYFVSEEEALAYLGLTEAGKTFGAWSWPDTDVLAAAGVQLAGIPDNHHLPEDVLNANEHISDHDGNLDLEKLKELKPEVFILGAKDGEKMPELVTALEEIGSQIISTKIDTYEDLCKTIAAFSIVGETEEAAKDSLTKMAERVEAAKSMLTEGIDKVALVTVEEMTENGYHVASPGSFGESLILELGLTNATAGLEGEKDRFGFTVSSLADIMATEPDSLVLMVRTTKDADQKKKDIEEILTTLKSEYGETDLVKNERFEVIDHHGVLPKSTLAVSGIENIADITGR